MLGLLVFLSCQKISVMASSQIGVHESALSFLSQNLSGAGFPF
jgi:hypothetical protein